MPSNSKHYLYQYWHPSSSSDDKGWSLWLTKAVSGASSHMNHLLCLMCSVASNSLVKLWCMQLLSKLVVCLVHTLIRSKLVLQTFLPYKLPIVIENSSRSTLTQSSLTSKSLVDRELFWFRSDLHLLLTIVFSNSCKSRENSPVAVDYTLFG